MSLRTGSAVPSADSPGFVRNTFAIFLAGDLVGQWIVIVPVGSPAFFSIWRSALKRGLGSLNSSWRRTSGPAQQPGVDGTRQKRGRRGGSIFST